MGINITEPQVTLSTTSDWYVGYKLHCTTCGYKWASYIIDRGNYTNDQMLDETLGTIGRQFSQITHREHNGHNIRFEGLYVTDNPNELTEKIE